MKSTCIIESALSCFTDTFSFGIELKDLLDPNTIIGGKLGKGKMLGIDDCGKYLFCGNLIGVDVDNKKGDEDTATNSTARYFVLPGHGSVP